MVKHTHLYQILYELKPEQYLFHPVTMFKLLVLSFITHERVLLLVKVQARKVTLLDGCFPRVLNCTNGTKSHKASRLIAKALVDNVVLSCSLFLSFQSKPWVNYQPNRNQLQTSSLAILISSVTLENTVGWMK